MRYRLAVLMLLAALPVMNVLAAPAPDPSAILDIGPPPKGETAEQHRKEQIDGLTCHVMLSMAWSDPEVKKLPSITPMKDARPWLAKNLRITEAEGGRRLRFTFRAGTRAEQVNILNALLRIYLRQARDERIKFHEEILRRDEKCILELEKRIKSSRDPQEVASYQKGINDLRSIHIPARRTEVARWKQVAVIKWAR